MPAAEEAASIPPRPRCSRAAVRARLLTVALVVLVGACGGATKFDDEVSVGEDMGVPTTVTSVPRAAESGSTTTQTTARAAAGRTSTSAAGRARAVPRTTATQAPARQANPSELAIRRAANGPPGAAAGIILQPTPARTLVVEVLEQSGAAANRPALDRVMADLRRFSGKPVSEVHTPLPGGSPSKRWTEPELEALADSSARVASGPDRFVLRLVFVRGQNARSGSILAVTFRGDTFAAFPDRYGSTGQQVITTVTVHEVGHLLGLVDLYLDRGRADTRNDPARGGHSSNPGSVMYYAVDPSVLGSLFGGASDRFDARDEQDLAAIRSGARFGTNP